MRGIPKISKKRTPGPKFQKLDHDYVRSLGITKKPTLDYSWRTQGDVRSIPSLGGGAGPCSTTSVMDPVALSKESAETQAAIVAKSKRIAIAYNKGAYQYISDDTDPTSLGSRSRR